MENCFLWIETKYGLNANSSMAELNKVFRDWNMAALVLIGVLILPGILGNSLVVAIFYRDFKKSAYRTFVLWLAVLDLAGCIIVMPYLMVNIITPVTMDNEIICKVGKFLSYAIMMTSYFILVIIALDRYRKICRPHSLQILQSQTSRYCLGMLTLSVIISVPAPILYGNSSLDIGIPGLKATRCFTMDKYKGTPAHLLYYAVINVLGATVTLIITILYVQVIRRIRYQFRQNKEISPNIRRNDKLTQKGSTSEEKINRKLVRTTVTLLAVTIIFVITIFPHTVLSLIDYSVQNFFCRLSFEEGVAYNFAIHFFLLNNVLNCVIYGFTDKQFKRRILLLFRRQQFNLSESSDGNSSNKIEI
ncbi:kappa-type opioid receptor-like [Saccostrea echinata]|uniref:kappa-type opioid receptor-like n=1 Tax=Saccostrea echinata TaxID=191078 RepID=UPI002A81C5F4|nr:kappa-type opioid receptor-like [Saccostrea echinata]